MDDVEHVLRFFTIKANWRRMGSVLGQEMDSFMAKNRKSDISNFERDFLRAVEGCRNLWGNHAYHKPLNIGWREQLISPLYDAEMVSDSMLTDNELGTLYERRNLVIERTKQLFFEDLDFVKSVTQSTNNSSAVFRRVETIYRMLKTIASE